MKKQRFIYKYPITASAMILATAFFLVVLSLPKKYDQKN
jgi:hypothetical protein